MRLSRRIIAAGFILHCIVSVTLNERSRVLVQSSALCCIALWLVVTMLWRHCLSCRFRKRSCYPPCCFCAPCSSLLLCRADFTRAARSVVRRCWVDAVSWSTSVRIFLFFFFERAFRTHLHCCVHIAAFRAIKSCELVSRSCEIVFTPSSALRCVSAAGYSLIKRYKFIFILFVLRCVLPHHKLRCSCL